MYMEAMLSPVDAAVERRYLAIEVQLTIRNYLIATVVLLLRIETERLYLTIETRLTTRNYLISNVVLPPSMDAERSYLTSETSWATFVDLL